MLAHRNTQFPEEAKQAAATKKASNVFATKKDAIYSDARKRGAEISQSGTQHIEEAKERLRAMKAQEITLDKHSLQYESLTRHEAFESFRDAYPPLFRELGPRRSETIEAASRAVKSNKGRRDNAMQQVFRDAGARIREAKENEKVNTDASALRKHLKLLLRF
ncbi:hypothetical protein CC1G_13885 [Coprinopsis cinerea okayama7|uniref:Uncharacterized protein n=1 Tax=Coprinopsis cinerea (strain Okayama-7 / 130 / ATCC MYA-4618 / FGSC 9003) TaxID=240176 RepID=D6RKM3_COPC7|nr:hypothetical protein CC1G_13885 [Coprinopsis cinerea okayama7\|eukprot:XP_002911849.1 hypothetical protein CC1G_13885 [Coprinopsis cinerea okayama7\